MRLLFITFGSRGDVQPYVALGQGLQAAGHEVTICTAAQYEPFVRQHGLDYRHMTGELLALLETDAGKQAMEETVGLLGSLKTMARLVKATKPLNREMMLDSWAAAQAVDPDLVLYHPKALAAVSIAEYFGVPAVMAILQPLMVPTGDFPTVGMPQLNIGAWYNRLSYKLVGLGYRQYAGMVDELRLEQMGLQKFPGSAGALHTAAGRSISVLHGFSSHVVPRPTDWPDSALITGYWFPDRQETWRVPAELETFLAAGAAPIYVGFGSMAGKDPQRLTGIVVEALQQAGLRGILATGWGGLQASDLPDTILPIEGAPHDWLFPRVAAVVHHGGAGTTAAGLRAGRPTLVCPFMGDQPFWGSRIAALGAGPEPIPQKKLTTAKLADALHALTGNGDMAESAARLGKQIRGEDGVANAVALIETLLQPARESEKIA